MSTDQEARPTGAENVAWDLTDLYTGVDDPAIERDYETAESRADALAERYRGHIADLSATELRDMIAEYEPIVEIAYKAGAFAYLHWSTNTEDAPRGALLQKTQERDSRLQQKLVFVELEVAAIPDEKAAALLADPVLARYRHWLEVTRMRRPYQLSEPEEKILAEKAITANAAWVRFFHEVQSAARFEWEGQSVPLQMVLTHLYDGDRASRRRAAEVATAGLSQMSRTTTFIFNTLLADKASDDRLRGFPTWISSRNLGNQVKDESVEALVTAVTARYDIVARYYRLKRRLLGLDELFEYDRYAPLPAADRFYPWDEACQITLNAYRQFSPRMAEIAQEFLDRHWIDAPVRPGKLNTAYSAGLTPSTHPYILLNYEAKSRDVMTLAHELGHGIHQYLYRQQGMLQGHTPLTTAEMASTFGERLVFTDLMARETDPQVRLAMLTAKLEDSFATIFRQIAMNRFEHAAHTARRERGELTTEQFNTFWLETQRAMFQDSVTLTDNYGLWWSYIPHFVETPGYVYAYAFGELLVLALYARYEETGASFADRYVEALTAGGSDWPHEIVRPLGVDLNDPDFWQQGLHILDEMVSEAERLAEQAG